MVDEVMQQERHQARMQRLKAKVDAKIQAAQEERGIVIVITGNGKGKSTSGFGTVARAVGHGLTTAVVQFIKGTWACGERDLLEKSGCQFHVMATGFTWETQNKDADIAAAEKVWAEGKKLLADPNVDLILFDELTYMLSYKYLDIDEVLDAIVNRPENQHVVVTGRGAHKALIEIADTVSEVQSIKHAFEAGIKAQKGVDW
ncbi:cob(I)yrinic acid a,c-diamide adenosyltransferase [Catenovulum maritimum]|uniref:Corrinoid adenosyltransferase n=1 Tax=Catenovulum maritimum TaxID=1513271 RepID=A0A0J8GVK6_9ALTE|nr:cob(I)yrinic acid a,c-diamide adenosyltransferase [Catenovulum maritimum]KMT65344.1 cobinamide adenolsyltransferase [Catenovulum maritimum]